MSINQDHMPSPSEEPENTSELSAASMPKYPDFYTHSIQQIQEIARKPTEYLSEDLTKIVRELLENQFPPQELLRVMIKAWAGHARLCSEENIEVAPLGSVFSDLILSTRATFSQVNFNLWCTKIMRPGMSPERLENMLAENAKLAETLEGFEEDLAAIIGAPSGAIIKSPHRPGVAVACAHSLGPCFSKYVGEMADGILLGNIDFNQVSQLCPETDIEIFRRVIEKLDRVTIDEIRTDTNKFWLNADFVASSALEQPSVFAHLFVERLEKPSEHGHPALILFASLRKLDHKFWLSFATKIENYILNDKNDIELPRTNKLGALRNVGFSNRAIARLKSNIATTTDTHLLGELGSCLSAVVYNAKLRAPKPNL